MCSPYSLLMCLYEAMLTWPGIPWLNYGLCAFSHIFLLYLYMYLLCDNKRFWTLNFDFALKMWQAIHLHQWWLKLTHNNMPIENQWAFIANRGLTSLVYKEATGVQCWNIYCREPAPGVSQQVTVLGEQRQVFKATLIALSNENPELFHDRWVNLS